MCYDTGKRYFFGPARSFFHSLTELPFIFPTRALLVSVDTYRRPFKSSRNSAFSNNNTPSYGLDLWPSCYPPVRTSSCCARRRSRGAPCPFGTGRVSARPAQRWLWPRPSATAKSTPRPAWTGDRGRRSPPNLLACTSGLRTFSTRSRTSAPNTRSA